jgi:hypothetical protein
VQTHELVPHPAYPPANVSSVMARIVGRDANWLRIRWRVEGVQNLIVPKFAGRGRADGLWRTTCFEMFVKPKDGTSYVEFNLSPSECWNIYAFDSPRKGMRELPMNREPDCTMRLGSSFAIFDAAIPADIIPPVECHYAMTCVIEEQGGTKSFWAFCHADDAPDFHEPACFTGELAAPTAP